MSFITFLLSTPAAMFLTGLALGITLMAVPWVMANRTISHMHVRNGRILSKLKEAENAHLQSRIAEARANARIPSLVEWAPLDEDGLIEAGVPFTRSTYESHRRANERRKQRVVTDTNADIVNEIKAEQGLAAMERLRARGLVDTPMLDILGIPEFDPEVEVEATPRSWDQVELQASRAKDITVGEARYITKLAKGEIDDEAE